MGCGSSRATAPNDDDGGRKQKKNKRSSRRGSQRRRSKRERKEDQSVAEKIRDIVQAQMGKTGGLNGMFRSIDADDSKGISFKEFRAFVKKHKGRFSDAEYRQAFDHIDDDGNGTIEFGEFKMWFGPI